MMALLENGKHELFAQKWHETENKSEAYRYAYPEHAEKWKEATINNEASKLSKVNEVSTRYNELKQETAENHGVTIDTLLTELDSIKALAMAAETPQCSAAVSSVMSKAKLCGLDVTRIELSTKEELTPWGAITASVDE